MPDLNVVHVAGRLTRDPDLTYTSGGVACCKIAIANTRHYKGKDGERNEDTSFIDATIWGPSAEFVGEKLRKGRPVLLEGRITSSSWEDRETGAKRSKTEINARRVTPLDWDEDKAGQGTPSPRPIEEPMPEDDAPF